MDALVKQDIADMIKVSGVSGMTITAWVSGIAEVIQEVGMTIVVLGNVTYIIYKLWKIRREMKWQKEDRLEGEQA